MHTIIQRESSIIIIAVDAEAADRLLAEVPGSGY
jgi:hypothetical protein